MEDNLQDEGGFVGDAVWTVQWTEYFYASDELSVEAVHR
jgi:hypothetical protein